MLQFLWKMLIFSRHICRIAVLAIHWASFFFIIYSTFTMDTEDEQWDPYEILALSEVGIASRTRSRREYAVSMATCCLEIR